jgi:hypothetical protein
MPEAVLENPVQTESLGWRAGLPDDLKQNETFVPFKTVGEFAKHHLEVSTKAADLEKKMGDYVPKLPDDASPEDRNLYYDALGRPKQPSEYEFDGEDKNAPEWTNFWKDKFHSLGLTKTQAKQLSGLWNTQMQQMVEAHNTSVKNEMTSAEQKLRSEMGDKFDTNVELAKRMTQKHLGTEFDQTFTNLPAESRFGVVKLLLKVAELTGEDRSPQAGMSQTGGKQVSFIAYDKSPAPPKK